LNHNKPLRIASPDSKNIYLREKINMIVENKLDKSFGPIGSVAGITLLIVGLILVYFSLAGLFLIILGAFVGLSSTSSFIDYERARMKFSTNLFGIISIGKWVDVSPDMRIGIAKSNKTWRAYSRGNRTLDITNQDFRITLYDSTDHPIMPINKHKTLDSARKDIEEISSKLGVLIN
jgi:hypothetical protein